MPYLEPEERQYTRETIEATFKAVRDYLNAMPFSAGDMGIDLGVLASVEAELLGYRRGLNVGEEDFIDGQYEED